VLSSLLSASNAPILGAREVQVAARESCEDRQVGVEPEIPRELDIVGYGPDQEAWAAGNRTAVCGLQAPRR
jgi:hypothetical protein